MSFNRACPDVPAPVIADSAVLLGPAWIGAGVVLAQGTVMRSHEATVSIDNHSAVLENSSVVGTNDHPVAIGQRTVFGHRCQVIGARIGNLCEVGNGTILMPGARVGDGCILGEAPSSAQARSSPTRRSWSAGPAMSSAPPPTPTASGSRACATTRSS